MNEKEAAVGCSIIMVMFSVAGCHQQWEYSAIWNRFLNHRCMETEIISLTQLGKLGVQGKEGDVVWKDSTNCSAL